MRKLVFALIVFCFLFSSCSNNVIEDKSTLEIEQKPIINDVENAEGLRVVSITNAEYYLYKMEPLWNYSKNDVPYGSTIGLEAPKRSDGTSLGSEYNDFKLIPASSSNLGYFSQGKWALTLYALDKDYNKIIKDAIYKEMYLNTFSNKISINLDNQLFVSGNNCSIKIDNFQFELTAAESMYGKAEKDGYKLTVNLYKVNNGVANSLSPVYSDPIDIPVVTDNKTNIEFFSKTGDSNDPKVYGVIKDFTVGEKLENGSYVVTLKLYEHDGSSFVDAGGITVSFIAKSGMVNKIEGTGKAIELRVSDYDDVGMGESGIIIDSGVDATISIEAAVNSNALQTSTVNEKDVVAFTGKVNGAVTSGRWFVNGEPQSTTGVTFEYNTTGMAGKTVTITYMIMDSSYNSISTNYYLKVEAASSTT